MKRLILAALLATSTQAIAYDPVADTRKIMAGTVTTAKIKNEYLSGARDGTTVFKGALSAYKAVRAADIPAPVQGVTVTGDSFSIKWAGNWTGMLEASRPAVPLTSLAVGGSGLGSLETGVAAAVATKPKLFIVWIGANETLADPLAFTSRLFAYTDKLKATGAKVAIGTIAYQCNKDAFNAGADAANAVIMASTRVDARIPFHAVFSKADACNTALSNDGVHWDRGDAQQRLYVTAKPIYDALLDGKSVPPPVAPPPTVTWRKCADEGQTCYLVGTANVRYGANGIWVTGRTGDKIECTNLRWGGDPVPNVPKICETDGTVGIAPPPSTTPPTDTSGDVLSPSLAGLPPIPSAFDPKLGMYETPPPTTLYGEGLPLRAIDGKPTAGQDGAFRFTAGGDGPLAYDDPLAFFGLPGAAHLHQFFCGVNIDAFSTYPTIRKNPTSNCSSAQYPLNPSGYWVPAMIWGANVLRPQYISVYYKGCSALPQGTCQPSYPYRKGIKADLPHGISLIGGWDVQKPNGADGIANNADDAPGSSFYCTGGTGGHFNNLDDIFASGCKEGDLLVWDLAFGDCWDGKRLDSRNHRDHLSFPSYGSWGFLKCPATHPYSIPQPEFKVTYRVKAGMYAVENGRVVSKLKLSSDDMKPDGKPGTSAHGDWEPAWDPTALQFFHRGCIDKGLDCVAGNFGNGWGMRDAWPLYGWTLENDVVPIPPRVTGTVH